MAFTEGQLWVYNSTTGTWQNKNIGAVDGDQLEITWDPSNYVPDASIAEADDVDDLAAHLKGIDTGILATFKAPVVFAHYIDTNARASEYHLYGGIAALTSGETLSGAGGFSTGNGISRHMLVVNAGADMVGAVTLTGTSVDRDDGAESGGATEELTLIGMTTDGSGVDADGNDQHAFTRAYISTKWWRGSVAYTTADVDLSDADVYAITFEQYDDEPVVEVKTLDITYSAVTGVSDFRAYLYKVINTGTGTWDIIRVSAADIGDAAANLALGEWRWRRAGLGVVLDGSTDGVFVDMFPGGNNRFEDLSIKLWADVTRTVILGV